MLKYQKHPLVLCLILFLSFFTLNKVTGSEQLPQVIFLTGPSSSGKTTLAKALQKALDQPYLYLCLDQIIEMMPSKINQWNDDPSLIGFGTKRSYDQEGHLISKILIGPFAEKMRQTFKDVCLTMAEKGHFIIIDDIFFQEFDVSHWEEALRNFDVFWVRLKAPLSILESREQQREYRDGCSRFQYYNAYHRAVYDLEIDTSVKSIEESVSLVQKTIHMQ